LERFWGWDDFGEETDRFFYEEEKEFTQRAQRPERRGNREEKPKRAGRGEPRYHKRERRKQSWAT